MVSLTSNAGQLQWLRVDSYKDPESTERGGSAAEWGILTPDGGLVVVNDDPGAGGLGIMRLAGGGMAATSPPSSPPPSPGCLPPTGPIDCSDGPRMVVQSCSGGAPQRTVCEGRDSDKLLIIQSTEAAHLAQDSKISCWLLDGDEPFSGSTLGIQATVMNEAGTHQEEVVLDGIVDLSGCTFATRLFQLNLASAVSTDSCAANTLCTLLLHSPPGSTSPPPPAPPEAVIDKDPHLHLPHGGKADFRGRSGAFYNFFSAPGISLNVRTEDATFTLHEGKLVVDGSFITEAPARQCWTRPLACAGLHNTFSTLLRRT